MALLRSALLGLATGGRSSLGIAALALSAPRTGSWLTSRWARGAAAVALAGELTVDKLPATPSRLDAGGQVFRVLAGAASGAILSHRQDGSTPRTALSAGVGAAAALAGTRLGARWRAVASDQLGSDWPGALAEDVTVLVLARSAVRAH